MASVALFGCDIEDFGVEFASALAQVPSRQGAGDVHREVAGGDENLRHGVERIFGH
jgi:hypothetical protein